MDEPNAKLAWAVHHDGRSMELRCPCGDGAWTSPDCACEVCVRHRALARCPGCGRPVTPPGLPATPG